RSVSSRITVDVKSGGFAVVLVEGRPIGEPNAIIQRKLARHFPSVLQVRIENISETESRFTGIHFLVVPEVPQELIRERVFRIQRICGIYSEIKLPVC